MNKFEVGDRVTINGNRSGTVLMAPSKFAKAYFVNMDIHPNRYVGRYLGESHLSPEAPPEEIIGYE